MACPECSTMDWSDVPQTTEHHPACGLAPFPDADAQARMREAVRESQGGMVPTLVKNGVVYPKGEFEIRTTLCKSCHLPVGSGGCICVENMQRETKGRKVAFRSSVVEGRILHFLSTDIKADIDLTPIWGWLEAGGGFRTAWESGHEMVVIERMGGARIPFCPKIGAWGIPSARQVLEPETFSLLEIKHLRTQLQEQGNWQDVSPEGVSGAEKMRGQSTDRLSALDKVHREFWENVEGESAIVRCAMAPYRAGKVDFETAVMECVNHLVTHLRVSDKVGLELIRERDTAMLGAGLKIEMLPAVDTPAAVEATGKIVAPDPEKWASTVLVDGGEIHSLTYYRYDGTVLFREGDKVK